MSMTPNGRTIFCDGAGCKACSPMPVMLSAKVRERLGLKDGEAVSVEGWLFVRRGGRTQHFCPICSKSALTSFSEAL